MIKSGSNKIIVWGNARQPRKLHRENGKKEALIIKKISKSAKKILHQLKIRHSQAEIFLMESRKMRALKKKFLKSDRRADVLSFSYPSKFPHPETKNQPLGEIYLNRNSLKNQGWPIFLIHGLLHLLGYTHLKKNDRMKMERLERNLYQTICPKI